MSYPSESEQETGIVFLKTQRYDDVLRFYRERTGMATWLEQVDCTILKYGNMLLGFCRRESADTQGIITFVYPRRSDVDRMYRLLRDVAEIEPRTNDKYRIYHFFARDPEGRAVEFQTFLSGGLLGQPRSDRGNRQHS